MPKPNEETREQQEGRITLELVALAEQLDSESPEIVLLQLGIAQALAKSATRAEILDFVTASVDNTLHELEEQAVAGTSEPST